MTLNGSNHIVATYAGLVTSWLNRLIGQELTTSIDVEQLATDILHELICYLRDRETTRDPLGENEIRRICRTITIHRMINAVRFAERQKRRIPTQYHTRLDLDLLHESDHCLRPDFQIEQDDFMAVLKSLIDFRQREQFELRQLGWTNQDIAAELHVSLRTVRSRFKTIEKAAHALLKKSDQPSTLNPTPDTRHPTPVAYLPL